MTLLKYQQECGNYDNDSCYEWPNRAYTVGGGDGAVLCQLGCKNNKCKGPSSCYYEDWELRGCGEAGCPGNKMGFVRRVLPIGCEPNVKCEDSFTCQSYVPSCTNECSAGQTECAGSDGTREYEKICGNYNDDSCLEFSNYVPGSGHSSLRPCQYGCNPSTNACRTSVCPSTSCGNGQTRCTPNTSNYTQTCLDRNNDGCPEWGSNTQCPTGKICSNGTCLTPSTTTGWQCVNSCPAGYTQYFNCYYDGARNCWWIK